MCLVDPLLDRVEAAGDGAEALDRGHLGAVEGAQPDRKIHVYKTVTEHGRMANQPVLSRREEAKIHVHKTATERVAKNGSSTVLERKGRS